MPADHPLLRFAHFELLPAERVLRVRGQQVAVGSRAFDLLRVLALHPERLVTKQELLDAVWPGLVVEEHNIATQISTLRKLLGATTIATLPGYGYRLTATAQPAPAAAPEPEPTCHNLPDSRTRFIGREAALDELARLLPSTRLLTLTGIGGCGKTRLALQFAQQRLADFDGGVWFVDLAPVNDGDRVAAACAAVLGLRDDGDAPLSQRLRAHLAQRRTLLLLDNCEHLLDAVAALVDSLLEGSAGATVLATSREALGVRGEQIVPVRSLSLPASGELAAVQAAESVRIFVDRARLVWPEFEVDAGNAAPLAEICRRLDGIALALELAAARVTMLSVADIAELLDDRFRLLAGGSRALPRHQTLQAAMQWSDELLSAAQRRMLRRMAVFAGGWTLPAAAAVGDCRDEHEALTLLSALHDKSLLVVDRDGDHDSDGGRPRYRMLETLRQYALQQLNDSGEGEAARGRHVAFLVALAEAAEAQVRGQAQDVWIARLRREHDNLIAALTWCTEGPVDIQLGLRLAAASYFYWVWNSVELGYRLTRAVIERDTQAADTPARVGGLRSLARLSLFRGRDEALDHARQALAVARRLDQPRLLAQALREVGSALNAGGQIDAALQSHREALALARLLGDSSLVSPMLNDLAEAERSAGQLAAAEAHYREALASARGQEGRLSIAVLLNNLIRVQVALGRADRAWPLARECLPLVRGHKLGVDLLDAAVGLAACEGEHAQAARLWGAADRTLRDWGYRHTPVDIEHTERLIAACQSALGAAAFEAEAACGRALGFDAAMHELAGWLERPR